jgi:ribosomal protein L7/L12
MPNQPSWERLAELDARLVRRDEVERLLQAGQKIAAIKLYREETGASLGKQKMR